MLISFKVRHTSRRRGAVVAWVLVCLVAIMGIVAIGMDGGRMLEKRRQAQATADAAALAAATSMFQYDLSLSGALGSKKSGAQSAALNAAAANGFNNDGTTSTVTVNIPPASGAFSGQTDYVEVLVQYNLSKSFGAIFTKNNLPVTARAVAAGKPLQLGVLALAQTGSGAFQNSCKSTVNVVNGRIFVNSSDAQAFSQTKGTLTAVTCDIRGNYSISGTGAVSAPLRVGVRRTPDPLLALPAPDPSSLSVQSTKSLTISKGNKTLSPGVYTGGVTITGNASVTMLPGIYLIQGGGFQVKGNSDLAADSVFIYSTSGSSGADQIAINSNGNVAISPAASGTYRGVSIFQDRSVTQLITISGSGSTAISGVVYAPAAAVQLQANNDDDLAPDTLGGAFICSTMQISGNGSINIDSGTFPLQLAEITLAE